MEINGKHPLAGLNHGVQRLDSPMQQASRTARASGASPASSDRIELSVRSQEIQQLDEIIQSVPDVRDARVEQIRRSLESGTYNVRAEKIADKILSGSLIDEVF